MFDSRRETYVELVKHLQRLQDWMMLTDPIAAAVATVRPPRIEDDEEQGRQRLANTTVFASSAVHKAALECTTTYAAFRVHETTKRHLVEQLGESAADAN